MIRVKKLKTVVIASLALFISSCGVNSVVVQGSYPSPNIRQIPLAVGVYYGDELRNFSYTEYSETGKEEYKVDSGLTHIQLFGSVLPAMFARVVVLDELSDATSAGVDAVFAPSIEEFQLALPQKTRLDAYEVWVKYNMRLLAPDGGYIADWVVTSYGKTPTESMRSVESGINDATVGALRDLASNFSLSFGSVPEVRDWLASKQ
ncbi:MAG: hypothetical protein Q8L60_15680 [Gammaproteobacteria bacterium]|nr:hypothetical protein [Gammaproteobacteria bacterium]MDP2139524.1 hypothetical protein [Gammaproteobacteria bacterium]MDP2346497.1 hypothetical protein [Gammaproteobacteria bacterium]